MAENDLNAARPGPLFKPFQWHTEAVFEKKGWTSIKRLEQMEDIAAGNALLGEILEMDALIGEESNDQPLMSKTQHGRLIRLLVSTNQAFSDLLELERLARDETLRTKD